MEGPDAGAVQDLLAAGSARRGDDGAPAGLPDRREENHLADGHRGRVMLLFVAEGTRHAAAAGGNDVELAPFDKVEHGDGLFNAHKRFLMAVAMEPYLNGISFEIIGINAACVDFTYDELVEKQGITS